MWLDPDRFRLHDVTEFPLIWTGAPVRDEVNARRWQVEMDALVAQGSPFVILHRIDGPEPAEARKARISWLKHNKRALAQLCLAVVAIEVDPIRRTTLDARVAIANQSYGVKAAVVASAEEGEDLAWEILFCTPSNHGALGVFPAE
ncbi:hypothetical protein IAG41_19445 [Sphingomonas sp. JC676]|uniref:hypothetical protein n=1 Tax=Sphingomonas sp. JC676 TaxID=2768065 RepID=UPI0016576979|nr:hypothetical protein [Sphingomonas sp. JC676]MBC9034569.1 hypothetical protein [Sphingomonas sp. JC676]